MDDKQTSPQNDDDANSDPFIPWDTSAAFNQFLGANSDGDPDGIIVINGLSYLASMILYKADRDAYDLALSDFQEQQANDQEQQAKVREQLIKRVKERILKQFPTPLAHRFAEIEDGWSDYRHRFELLKDFWETIISVLFAVVVGEAQFKNIALDQVQITPDPKQPTKKRALTLEDLLSDQLATKLNVISAILEFESNQGLATKSLALIPLETIAQIRELNKARNAQFGHAETKSEEQAEGLFNSLYPDVIEVCDRLSGLASVKFLRYMGGEDAQNPRFECFDGNVTTRRYEYIHLSESQVTASLSLLTNKKIVVKIGDEIYGVAPFLHFVSGNEGHVTKLCGYKKKIDGDNYDYSIFGESSTRPLSTATFQNEIAKLRSLLNLPPAQGNNP